MCVGGGGAAGSANSNLLEDTPTDKGMEQFVPSLFLNAL